ncbi:hypothetical protein [Streptomyces sp. OfavH-34-F]|nr:hypothetical protein [Streptomyces sp. OfavH-34-F]
MVWLPRLDVEHPDPALTNGNPARSDLIGDLDQGRFETPTS